MEKISRAASGALGWIFSRGIKLLVLAALILPAGTSARVLPLVERAAQPEVMFSRTAHYDSLLTEIAAGGRKSAGELLDLADTPWAWQFEVIRSGMQRIGEPAREAILERLVSHGSADPEVPRLLVLLEKLGREGDESRLAGYLRAGRRVVTVPALRCLAAFGAAAGSLEMISPLLRSGDSHIRLAAAWAVGEIMRRSRITGDDILPVGQAVRELLDDPVLQVRLTASETLHSMGEADEAGLVPIQED